MVSLIYLPAAIVSEGELIVAQNQMWLDATGTATEPTAQAPLRQSLRGFFPLNELLDALGSSEMSAGVVTVQRVGSPDSNPFDAHEYTIRWRQLRLNQSKRDLTMVVLHSISELEHLTSVVSSQHVRINRLLIRQTLIEEAERRRLGMALHDVVAQNLAIIRSLVGQGKLNEELRGRVLPLIDRVIEDVRTLSFEISPPILEDLGLCPALQWLADHLNKRYKTRICVSPTLHEPTISKESRTIVFRAVRELSINAAKYASESEITIECGTEGDNARIAVVDTGPGFNVLLPRVEVDGVHNFGLLSVEQQIRGIGGRFELISRSGVGTRATILVPLVASQGAKP